MIPNSPQLYISGLLCSLCTGLMILPMLLMRCSTPKFQLCGWKEPGNAFFEEKNPQLLFLSNLPPPKKNHRFSPTVGIWFQIFLNRHDQFDKWLKQATWPDPSPTTTIGKFQEFCAFYRQAESLWAVHRIEMFFGIHYYYLFVSLAYFLSFRSVCFTPPLVCSF